MKDVLHLFPDNKEEKGSIILNEFIKQNVNLRNNTHLVCLENNPSILSNMPNLISHSISDPLGWLHNKPGLYKLQMFSYSFQ